MPHGFMPVAGRLAGLSLAAWLTLAALLGAAEDYFVSVLPEMGRAAKLSEFAKACKLD
jgi:hypothetical protein